MLKFRLYCAFTGEIWENNSLKSLFKIATGNNREDKTLTYICERITDNKIIFTVE